jgi:L-glutamine-phosphate cytidylyltransferase
MKVVILAAGMGKRLSPIIHDVPKCLAKVGKRSLIIHLLDRLKKYKDISEIIIVAGYKEKVLRQECVEYNVTFISNDDFEGKNNIYSLWLAKKATDGHDTVIINGDDLLNQKILDLVVNATTSVAAIDPFISRDAMRVSVEKGRIIRIGKDINLFEAHGNAIGAYKLLKNDSKIFFDEMDRMIKDKRTDTFYLRAMDRILNKINLQSANIGSLAWSEIDDALDLVNLKLIYGRIVEQESNNDVKNENRQPTN